MNVRINLYQNSRIFVLAKSFLINWLVTGIFCCAHEPIELSSQNSDSDYALIKKDIEIIGFNITYFDKISLASWRLLLESYKKVPGWEVSGELVKEDIDFFKIYSHIFSEEYYSSGTISGYVNYEFKPELLTPRVEAIVEATGLIKNRSTILDFGCAKGFYVTLFNRLGYYALGVDISSYATNKSLQETRSHLLLFDNLNLLASLKAKNFDLVIMKDVLEHIPNKILPRLWQTIQKLGKKILVVIPICNEGESTYICETAEQDITHLIRWDTCAWLNFLLANTSKHYTIDPNLNHVLKGINSSGSLTVIID